MMEAGTVENHKMKKNDDAVAKFSYFPFSLTSLHYFRDETAKYKKLIKTADHLISFAIPIELFRKI